jgi:tetraacyldisaccharide 4'-kinase
VRRWIEGIETFAVDVILGRRYGRRADILRWLLHVLSWGYRAVVQTRLALYNHRVLRAHSPGVMVISIGNLTVGGTGKTPVVEMLARALQQGGRRVAVLSRGYKSVPKPLPLRLWQRLFKKSGFFAPRIVSDGTSLLLDSREAGDEPFMLASNLRGVVVLVDRDRVKSSAYAVRTFGADTLLLDDGFQYLRLRHSIEIALIDSEAPFGNEFLLPRGTLREPPGNLRRATHIFLTKCSGPADTALLDRIRRFNRTAVIIECAHRPVHLRDFTTGETLPLNMLRGMEVGALCGIAVPSSFEGALRALGAKIAITRSYTDHHRYSAREVEQFIRRCGKRALDAVITTEKDAVRIPRIREPEVPIYYLRVEIAILRGREHYEELVRRLTTPQPVILPHALGCMA